MSTPTMVHSSSVTLSRSWLAAILLFTIALHLPGLGYGLPYWLANDELPLIGGALRMAQLHNPIPSMNPGPMEILYYPPGLPWLYLAVWSPVLAVQWALAGFPAVAEFAYRLLTHLEPIWIASRLISVGFLAGTVWMVMRLSVEILHDRIAALAAGLLIATSFHHAILGQFARVWEPTVFFFWWGLWASWRIFSTGERRAYLWAALAAGIGFAVNYVGILVSLSVAVAHVARHKRIVIDRALLIHAAIVALFLAVILASSWPNFVRLLSFSPLGGDFAAAGKHNRTIFLLGFYGKTLLKSDFVLLAVGLLGLPIALKRNPAAILIFGATLVPYAILILTGYVDDDRYILPITPLLAFAGAFALSWRAVGTVILSVAIAIQLATIIRLDMLLARDDTRIVACAWIDANVPVEEGLLSTTRVHQEQTMPAIKFERSLSPGSFSFIRQLHAAGKIKRAGGCGLPRKAIRLDQVMSDVESRLSPDQLVARLRENHYRWLVTDRLTGATIKVEDILIKDAVLKKTVVGVEPYGPIFSMTDQFALGSEFDIYFKSRMGPKVYIYELKTP